VTTAEILARFPAMRALVVGDVCLDRWCHYDPSLSEPSRETGIPRIAVTSTESTPGAAGTIAANLAAMNVGEVSVLGIIGDDGYGFELQRSLKKRSIVTTCLIRSPLISTFTYTKLLNVSSHVEDLPRLDLINAAPLPHQLESQMLDVLDKIHRDFDVILVSDQAETAAGGAITAKLRDALAILGKPVWVDSRARCELFRNVILKPNRDEASAACARIGGDDRALYRYTQSKLLIVTEGAAGALVIDSHGETRVPARTVDHPVDVCGAGDSFAAGAAMALAVTGSPLDAVKFGSLVASITVMKPGTGTASPQELIAL